MSKNRWNSVLVLAIVALLGLATVEPGAGRVMSELLNHGRGLELFERPASPAELGRAARDAGPGVIAVLRAGIVLALDDQRAGSVLDGDRLVVVAGSSPLGAGQR